MVDICNFKTCVKRRPSPISVCQIRCAEQLQTLKSPRSKWMLKEALISMALNSSESGGRSNLGMKEIPERFDLGNLY